MYKIKKIIKDRPDLSIIIPVKDQLPYLDKCLASLQNISDVNYEIVIVNDGSNAETVHYLEQFTQLNIVHSQQSKGFVESCHLGVQRSIGKFLLFLNSDTELIEQLSFRKMLDCFLFNDKVGVVGARLLLENNTIQHAGLVFDPKQMNYIHRYYGKDKNDPVVCVNEVIDIVTGACLMTTRELWNKLNGFDKIYTPGYFEDTDFCLKAKEIGYNTIYCGEAIFRHYQSKSFVGGPSKENFGKNHEVFKQRYIRNSKVVKYPKIAACYITKDSEEFIEYSIRSVYDIVSKIIVIDNHSKDKTLQILEEMKDPDNKIVVISNDFKDKTEQRNTYCEMLDGYDYAWIIDSDEVWSNESLRKVEHLIFANPDIPAFQFNFYDFWKDLGHRSKGIWETFVGRKSLINLKLTGKIKYNNHTLPVLVNDSDIPSVFCQDIYFYHYSYVRTDEQMRKKIDYYVNTGTPGFEQQKNWFETVWLDWNKNPQEVEKKGTHLFGGGTTEIWKNDHPEVMITHPRYIEFLDKYKLKINMSIFPKHIDNFINIDLKNKNIFSINYIIDDTRPFLILIEELFQCISFNNIGGLLVKIYDSMEIGGEIVINTPNIIELSKKYINNEIQYIDFVKILYGNQTDSIDFNSCIYEPNSIKALLEDIGFNNISIENINDGFSMVVTGKKYKELK